MTDFLLLAGYLLGTAIACYGTYDKIKTGRAGLGQTGSLYIERETHPKGYWVSVAIGCVASVAFIGLTVGYVHHLIIK